MEYTRENVIASLRACAKTSNPSCDCCLYKELEGECVGQLKFAAAAMLEEIGKGELPRKPVEEERKATIEELWIEHERLKGRADAFGGSVSTEPDPPYSGSPSDDAKEIEEEIAYYTGFCDAAIVVIGANQARDGLPY